MSLQPYALPDAAQPQQPTPLLEEITHRVINEYAEAISGLMLASAKASARAQAALALAAMRLRAHAEVHRVLQPPIGDHEMDLGDYVARLATCLRLARLGERGVRISVRAEPVTLASARCWRVGLIVAELISNAARHGFRGGPGVIWVEIEAADGQVVCRVADDGAGATVGQPGRGTRVVEGLASELGGRIEWSFGVTGCAASLAFPAGAPPASTSALN